MRNSRNARTLTAILLPAILLLLAASAIISCAGEKEQAPDNALPRLQAIEAIAEDYPDSAATALLAISPDTLRTPASRALYYLLSTRAHTREQITTAYDRNITQSIVYYKSTGDNIRLANSYLYNARRLLLCDSLADAMINIREGLSLDIDTVTNAKFNNLAADIYLILNNIQKELVYRKLAFNACSQSNNTILYDYCLTLYTTSLINNNAYEEALDVITSYTLHTRPVIKSLLAELKSNEGMCLKHLGQDRAAKEILLEATKIAPEYVSSLAYRTLSEFYLNKQNTDSALFWLQKITEYHTKDISYYHGMVNYYNLIGDAGNALLMTDSISFIQDKKVNQTLQHEFNARLNTFDAEKENASKELYKRQLYRWMTSAVALLLFVLLTFIYYRRKNKSRNEEYRAKNSQLSALISIKDHDNRKLKQELAEKENDLRLAQQFIKKTEQRYNDVSQELMLFLRNRNSIFNKLCGEYFSHEGSSHLGKTAIYNKLKKEIDTFSSTKSINEIKNVVNRTNNDILIKLSEIFNLKEIDIVFIALTIAGFSAPIICYVTDITLANYYKKRSRFQAKFKEYQGEYSEEFNNIFQ